jgi:catechol 2,3-dioxygenase-like lactoylglutathione lyase family enzyme
MRIVGLNHVTLAVTDVARSFLFYRELLGFRPLCKWPAGAYFLIGDFWFCLNLDNKRQSQTSPDYTHIAFTVDSDNFAFLKSRLLDAGVQPFKENTSEGDSFYFLDPDGHKLEIHVGDWKSRLASKKKDPWPGTEFFV